MARKLTIGALALAGIMAAPVAQAQEKYIGEIFLTGANFCPRGTADAAAA